MMMTMHPSKRRGAFASALAAFACMLAAAGMAHAQSLDELLDIEPAQPPAKQPSASPDKPSDDDKPQQSKPLVTPPGDAGDPSKVFDRALERMREASSRLGDELDTGLATQRLQESALELMDQVIAQAMQQQRQQQQQSSPQQQNQQAQQQQNGSDQNAQQSPGQRPSSGSMSAGSQSSQASQGQTSPGSPADAQAGKPIEETGDQWGTLPPRLRQQLLQSMSERFSPIYQQMTEAYYKKLAQEATP